MTWFVLLAVFFGLMVIARTWFPGLHLPLLPFPGEWRTILERRVRFYRRLDPAHRKKFERDVLDVLSRGKIRGREGYRPDEQARLLVAAGFATLFHAMAKRVPAFKQDVVIVPGTKAEDVVAVAGKIATGVVGTPWMWGPMYVAAGAMLEDPQPGSNPVLHRLAHYLDFNLKRFAMDDLPAGLQPSQEAKWRKVRDLELEKLKAKTSPFPDRSQEGRGELFACAVEMFFENPGPLKAKSPELYDLLRGYFLIDPCALFSGRSLDRARVEKFRMPCPHCQEEIEWGLAQCPFCEGKLDDSYLTPDKSLAGEGKKAGRCRPLPRREVVNWLGMVGVALAFLGISAIIVTVFAGARFPWIERSWPALQLLFGCWVLWMRRREWRHATYVPLAIGFLFRGLQLGLSQEEWNDVTMVWPAFLFLAGVVWVFVCSPEWRKKNGLMRWWPWPRDEKGGTE